jgi:serine/threonine protein kinase
MASRELSFQQIEERKAESGPYNRGSPMRLTAGTRFGAYEIRSALAVGGMGEVYRARDTKLGRDVAIKVVSAPFTRPTSRSPPTK